MTLVSISLPSLQLDDDDNAIANALVQRLASYALANFDNQAYYEGEQLTRRFGISIPPSMQGVRAVSGWGGTAVDVLEERLDWLGWTDASGEDRFGLEAIYNSNNLDIDSGQGHLDALIHGTSFIAVGEGDEDETSPLVTVHSALGMTGIWDARQRRLSSALSVISDDSGTATMVSLFLPDRTLTLERTVISGDPQLVLGPRAQPQPGAWKLVEVDDHRLGRVPVVAMPNRPRAGRPHGRSEITKAVKYWTDAATRTALAMEVSREFYAAPQRWATNIAENAFKSENGATVSGWEAVMGRVLALTPNEDGTEPHVGQFTGASPAPYVEQINMYAVRVAAEVGFPVDYLGIQSANPSSADAIRQAENRLVKRAERRQSAFGRAWLEAGRLALLVRDGVVPEEYGDVTTKWRDPSTPTRAASADEATKLIASGVLLPDSGVTYDRIGLTPSEQARLVEEKRRQRVTGLLGSIGETIAAASPEAIAAAGQDGGEVTTPEQDAMQAEVDAAKAMGAKFEALGQGVRAGGTFQSVADLLGLEGLEFSGATPVSLRQPLDEARQLEDR